MSVDFLSSRRLTALLNFINITTGISDANLTDAMSSLISKLNEALGNHTSSSVHLSLELDEPLTSEQRLRNLLEAANAAASTASANLTDAVHQLAVDLKTAMENGDADDPVLPKLHTPVIRLVTSDAPVIPDEPDEPDEPDVGNTPAILGIAILGRTILGRYDSRASKLDSPVIRFETEQVPVVQKLSAPTIRIENAAAKLGTPRISGYMDEAPVIRLNDEGDKIVWDDIPGATQYRLTRTVPSGSSYTRYGIDLKRTYYDTYAADVDLESGDSSEIQVYAFCTPEECRQDYERIRSDWSNTLIYTKP